MADALFRYQITWGSTSTSLDNVTTDVRAADAVTVDRGVDVALSPLAEVLPGSAEFVLKNQHYRYHPESTGSPLTGNVTPGKQTEIRAVSPSTGHVFKGRTGTFDYTQSPDAQASAVTVTGPLTEVAKATVTTAVYQGIKTGAAVGHVLDAAGWSTSRRQLDDGATVMPLWFVDRNNALNALRSLVESEGPGAALFESADGDIVFHDRHRQLTQTASKVSQATWRNGNGSHPWYQIPATYDAGWDYIVNDVTITPRQFTLSAQQYLWHSPTVNYLFLTAGNSYTFTVLLNEPAAEVTTPTVDTQADFSTTYGGASWDPFNLNHPDILVLQLPGFAADDSDLGVAVSAASGTLFDVTLTNNHGTDSLAVVQIRLQGRTFEEAESVESVTAASTASQDAYGVRSLPLEDVWMGLNEAQDIADMLANDFSQPSPRVTVPITNLTTAEWNQQIGREISDRVTIVDTRSGMNRDFHVQRVTHSIEDGGKYVRAVFDTVAVPADPLVGSTEVFILDSTSQGILDTNKLGY